MTHLRRHRRLRGRPSPKATMTIRSMATAAVLTRNVSARLWPTSLRRTSFRTLCWHRCCTKILVIFGSGRSFLLASRWSRRRSCCGHTHGLGKNDVQLRGHSRHGHGNWVVQRLLSRGQRECGRSSQAFWHQFGGLGAIQYLARILAGYSAEDFSPQRRLGAAKLGPAGSNRTHLLLARKCGGVPTAAQGFDQIDGRSHAPLQDGDGGLLVAERDGLAW